VTQFILLSPQGYCFRLRHNHIDLPQNGDNHIDLPQNGDNHIDLPQNGDNHIDLPQNGDNHIDLPQNGDNHIMIGDRMEMLAHRTIGNRLANNDLR
jgi:hypothetical protein